MSRVDQHSAFGFLVFYIIYVIWTQSFIMDGLSLVLILFFSVVPDLDILYGAHKREGLKKLDEEFQHHYFSIAHYPLVYVPFIIVFLICLILNSHPLYFFIPVIGIYVGHFFLDSLASGDGIMWGKNPFKKEKYARFINLYCKETDGFHGIYGYFRYRKTFIGRLTNYCVILAIILIQSFPIINAIQTIPYQYNSQYYYYISALVYLILSYYVAQNEVTDKYSEMPPKGRYHDYRIDPKYINGLSEKNRERHLKKYSNLIKQKAVLKTSEISNHKNI